MTKDEMISADEFCIHHQIELAFIRSLTDAGLIEVVIVHEKIFVPLSQLPRLEKLARLHYELDINMEGLEAIHHLLGHMNALEHQVTALANKLLRYET
ncbi:MAG: MerR family transcriptional regulator [Azospira oryzae]|jgi:hypothetical protein|nr:MAG: MerR family transcriptional regulator [Azospira oryzae]